MRPDFVETANYKAFLSAMGALNDRGAAEACILVVDGNPGLGKTTAIYRWAAQTGSAFVRAQIGWDYNWFVDALLKNLGIHPPRGKIERYERLTTALSERAEAARHAGRTFGIVIDECDLVSSRREVMEAIRGISDLQQFPTILVGMGRLRDNLRRFPQIESRAPRKVEFKPSTLADTAAIIRGKCEVPVADDLVDYVWRMSRGFNREILEAIAHIERFGLRASLDGQGVSIAMMRGQPIMNDRTTGNLIEVRAA